MTTPRPHLLFALFLVAGCDSGALPNGDAGADAATAAGDGPAAASDSATAASDGTVGAADLTASAASDGGLVVDRPYKSRVPAGYNGARPTPLLILLHGYSADGAQQDAYFGLSRIVDDKGFLYAYPDGTFDQTVPPKRFWNATDSCCNFFNSPVDDVAYVNAIIDDMSKRYNVDARRIFVVGHSNGGFMAHRFACDSASRVAAIIALAGDNWNDPARCQPTAPVSVLQIHGDNDATIHYGGGHPGEIQGIPAYPSAHDSVATWALKNGCKSPLAATGKTLDLERLLPGAETRVDAYGGCNAGVAVELWTIQGGGHVPSLQPAWAETLYTWAAAHPKP